MPASETHQSRREFIARTGLATAGVLAAGSLASARPRPSVLGNVLGANERINIAAIGIRSRGMYLAENFAKLPNVTIKTLVDIDENLFAERVPKIEQIQGVAPGVEWDLRRALDDPEIDAVTIATPDHWHALATIWACQAGKHVYVEKPVFHNIWEGRKMVEAARKYDSIVSAGFHNRSIRNVRKAMKFLHDGGIGDIYMAKGLCFKPRDGIGRVADSETPAGVHYDMWLGCTPKRPFNNNRFHYNWHWFWDYGCGDIGNQGPHQFDIARWGMNKHEHPVKIHSSGGYFVWDSDQETPNTQIATYEYADGTILQFEVRGLYTNDEDGVRIGNLFFGSKGWMHLGVDTKWSTYFGRNNEPGPNSDTAEEETDPMNLAGSGGGSHFENFIIALRNGNRDHLTCEIDQGRISTALPHLGNIAYRVGRSLTWDGKKEHFVGDDEANTLLKDTYREPYVVPDRV